MIPKITHWKARRSGAHLTVIGKDEGGGHVKVAAVTEIDAEGLADGKPMIARTESGLEYELA